MKQETGRQQPGIPFLQGGEDVNWEEMKVYALDLMADLERQVNSRHIIDRHFVIRPRT